MVIGISTVVKYNPEMRTLHKRSKLDKRILSQQNLLNLRTMQISAHICTLQFSFMDVGGNHEAPFIPEELRSVNLGGGGVLFF